MGRDETTSAGIPAAGITPGTEILVVDPSVGDAALLLQGMRAGVEVLYLAPGGRGLEQIAEFLAPRDHVAGLHILCHGEPGALWLAGERVDLAALAVRPGTMACIAAALARDASVTLYGCSVAAGPKGWRFLDYLETVLGVAVAASVGPVGAAALGGSWMLRRRGGGVAEPAFAPKARAAYPALLASLTGTADAAAFTRSRGFGLI